MQTSMRKAFTLVELLLVVAIIAVLAAIAIPDFLLAQVKAKTSRALADLRTIGANLEAYSIDNNGHYPRDRARSDLAGYLVAPELTTPIAYVSSIKSIIDPFRRDLDLLPADADEVYRYWNLKQHNGETNPTPSALNGISADGAWIVSSAGPDGVDQYPLLGDHQYETIEYEATNGTTSRGDIIRTAKMGQKQ